MAAIFANRIVNFELFGVCNPGRGENMRKVNFQISTFEWHNPTKKTGSNRRPLKGFIQ
jgi:hypothetical protein